MIYLLIYYQSHDTWNKWGKQDERWILSALNSLKSCLHVNHNILMGEAQVSTSPKRCDCTGQVLITKCRPECIFKKHFRVLPAIENSQHEPAFIHSYTLISCWQRLLNRSNNQPYMHSNTDGEPSGNFQASLTCTKTLYSRLQGQKIEPLYFLSHNCSKNLRQLKF